MTIFKNLVLLASVVTLTVSCSKNISVHGYTRDPDKIQLIKENLTTKDQIVELIGSPSTKSELGEDTWYYISSKVESIAFLNPKLIEQDILVIDFNNQNQVKSIRYFNLNDTNLIDFSKEHTVVRGNEKGVLREFIGNIGKFNKKTHNRKVSKSGM